MGQVFSKKSISVTPKINFGSANFGCGLCARGRGAAVPKLLADTLRMLALLGCIPSCARRRARPGTGVYALARAPACKRARARMQMHTLTCRCKICKTVMFTKNWMCTVRVRRSGPKSVPFADPKTWPIFCSVFLFAWGCFVRSHAKNFLSNP